jgi:3-oxoacyl-[acyl-carrier-protein] synthase II
MPRSTDTRVVITGMGAITPLGNSVEEFWSGCVDGRSGISWITVDDPKDYPVKIDGEVRGFRAEDFMSEVEAHSQARFSQFGIAAARMAIDDARLDLAREHHKHGLRRQHTGPRRRNGRHSRRPRRRHARRRH